MAVTDLGRTPLDFRAIHIATALTEVAVDLPLGCRGVMIKSRQTGNSRHVRISSIKGEVSKPSSDNTARYWSTDGNANIANPLSIMGFRVMQEDAQDAKGNPKPEQAAGVILQQRIYVTAEVDATTIEMMIMPGF